MTCCASCFLILNHATLGWVTHVIPIVRRRYVNNSQLGKQSRSDRLKDMKPLIRSVINNRNLWRHVRHSGHVGLDVLIDVVFVGKQMNIFILAVHKQWQIESGKNESQLHVQTRLDADYCRATM